MVVVDASAIGTVLRGGSRAVAIAERLGGPSHAVHAPHHVDLEVLSTLRRWVRQNEMDDARANESVRIHRALRIERHDPAHFIERIWTLRHNLTPYDAAYVALAEALDAPLLTSDARLARSTGHQARIELV